MSTLPPSTLDTLPPELQLNILSRLGYLDLLRVSSASKKLHNLLKDRTFDETLFRTAPPPNAPIPILSGTDIIIHPAFSALNWMPLERVYKCTIGNSSRATAIKRTPVINENATSPGVQKMRLYFPNFGQSATVYPYVTGSLINVRDVLETINDLTKRMSLRSMFYDPKTGGHVARNFKWSFQGFANEKEFEGGVLYLKVFLKAERI